MTLEIVRAALGWCAIINFGLLIWWLLFLTLAHDWTYRIHSKWFPMSREAFNVVIYSFVGVFKLIWIAFNVVPYVALLIIG